jgi:hypothetical protein
LRLYGSDTRFRRIACRISNRKFSLTNKFARRFVIVQTVIIRFAHRYLDYQGAVIASFCLATPCASKGDLQMRRIIPTILGSTLIAALTVQIATAAEHHKVRKVYHEPAPASEPIRNSNAYYGPGESGWSHYSGGYSAPAGR